MRGEFLMIISYTFFLLVSLESALGYFFCLRDRERIRIIFRIQPLSSDQLGHCGGGEELRGCHTRGCRSALPALLCR
jgi:hypothetical protein